MLCKASYCRIYLIQNKGGLIFSCISGCDVIRDKNDEPATGTGNKKQGYSILINEILKGIAHHSKGELA
jgi:hypothetical protein